ncbi:hypothetical protein [Streptomyces sp. adm13(2018)]|uniref:hypothetical protein n=1 Tax=Streptomyces sp. adm13(2018) TaxID=2479007 RepID=UPI0021C7C4C3|nr:hypothetical protein [Streptomyces sp. adm13(2018)]
MPGRDEEGGGSRRAPSAGAPSRRRERPGSGTGSSTGGLAELSRRRPRKTAAVAGAIAFVVFLVIGMAWLS